MQGLRIVHHEHLSHDSFHADSQSVQQSRRTSPNNRIDHEAYPAPLHIPIRWEADKKRNQSIDLRIEDLLRDDFAPDRPDEKEDDIEKGSTQSGSYQYLLHLLTCSCERTRLEISC